MKKKILTSLTVLLLVFGVTGFANAALIDFSGGMVFFGDGTSAETDNTTTYYGVDYYVEDSFKIDFIGTDTGIIGDFYDGQDSVLHAHWDGGSLSSIEVSMLNGSLFDLNAMGLTSNTKRGGMASTGDELTFLTASTGSAMLLPSSDWGIDYLMDGSSGDGVQNVLFGDSYNGISSFTITSENGYCFGIGDFDVDPVPEPATVVLFSIGLAGLFGTGIRRKMKVKGV